MVVLLLNELDLLQVLSHLLHRPLLISRLHDGLVLRPLLLQVLDHLLDVVPLDGLEHVVEVLGQLHHLLLVLGETALLDALGIQRDAVLLDLEELIHQGFVTTYLNPRLPEWSTEGCD